MLIPPVGQMVIWGSGLASDFTNALPPAALAGKNFIAVKLASRSVMISETVDAPGNSGRPAAAHPATTAGVVPGDTAKPAPALRAASAKLAETTVPAPTQISGQWLAMASMAAMAAGVRRVI